VSVLADTWILGIESSCDETAVALLRNGTEVVCSLVASQAAVHRRFGGVVPEVASRQHIESIHPLIAQALVAGGIQPRELGAIAATYAPGLVGALLVGLVSAKAAAWALDLPFIGVHHLAAHIWANVMANPALTCPFLCLLVSGGHTALVRVKGPLDYDLLGETLDDAAGEAYDKVARLLGLPYPGGPEIDRLAVLGNPKAFKFPRAMRYDGSLDFSFSGLKTAVRLMVEKHQQAHMPVPVADIAASFQAAVVDVLVAKSIQAAEQTGITHLTIAGGVAANSALRSQMAAACNERHLALTIPPLSLCGDNAAMIAGLGHAMWRQGVRSPLSLGARSRLALPSLASGDTDKR